MNKDEAIAAMKRGERVRHKYFSPDEWMTYKDGYFHFEDGVKCTPEFFWMDRTQSYWDFDWSLAGEPMKA